MGLFEAEAVTKVTIKYHKYTGLKERISSLLYRNPWNVCHNVFSCQFSVPLIPSGFYIAEENFTETNLTVTFVWDEPQGNGPEAIVDNYIIVISPRPLSLPSGINVLPNSPQAFDVTLNYNTPYMATITAENCAGMSETTVSLAIEYGK